MTKTVTTKQQLLAEFAKTPIVQVACQKTGISRATYYRWRKDDPVFAESAEQALTESAALINDMAESQLIQAIKAQNMTAIIFWLKHRHRAYGTKIHVDTTHHLDEVLTPQQQEVVTAALKMSGVIKEQSNEAQ